MCGVSGALVFRESDFTITPRYVERMRDALEHRGPDGVGLWLDPAGRVGLGHRRLAIVDLSDSALQPMANEDGALRISFNGEIYNHAEIRAELERTGRHTWRTDHSDTEVILHAFEEWGIECVHRFRGMFAFALWDARTRDLWLVRDRIGIKPLYYAAHHGRFVFASEIKALLTDPELERRVDEEALYHYLSFLTTPAPQTLFAGIRKLAPGTWLRVREDGSLTERRYWDAWDNVTPLEGVSEEEIAERLLDELRTAVQLRKMSDVPVGVFLSGGIDSSANAVLFSEGSAEPVRTFTIGYEEGLTGYRSELEPARRMAGLVGAVHRERVLSADDLLALLPRMIYLQDEPIADPVCVPVYYVAELARGHGVIVCQLGEGSDELFFGYPAWQRLLRLQQLNDVPVPAALKRLGLGALDALGRGGTRPHEWLRRGAEGLPVFWSGAETFIEGQKRRLLSPRLRRGFAHTSSWEVMAPVRRRFEDAAWDQSHLNWMSYADLRLRLPELLLMRVDKMTMGVGLEARVPFLDHKLVELVLGIPTSVKLGNGGLKSILKRAVSGLVPQEVIQRPKQGFSVPVQDWLLGKLGDQVREEVLAFTEQTDLLDAAEVQRVLQHGEEPQVWCLFNLALWWRQYVAGAAPAGDLIRHAEASGVH